MPGLAAAVANQDVITYNGVTFPIAKSYKFSQTPVYDSTGRIVKYRQITLDVVAIFTPTDIGGNASDTFDTVASSFSIDLCKPGKTLIITGCGIGSTIITPATVLNRGPSPRIISQEPVGANNAIRVHWSVDFMVRTCTTGLFGEFSYACGYSYDDSGMLTRTISGQAEAFISFDANGNKTGTSAETLRDNISITPIPGFKRTQSWNVSNDQRILTFQIVDAEIPSDNPFAPGMVDMNIRHSITTANRSAGAIWNVSFSGSIRLAPGVPRGLAWQAFLDVFQSRKAFFTQGRSGSGKSSAIMGVPNVSIEEEIFGRGFSFSITFLFGCSLNTILQGSGLFQPVGGDWDTWNNSMLAKVKAVRGASNLATADSNIILSFCNNYESPIVSYTTADKTPPTNNVPNAINGEKPTEDNSYLDYQNNIRVDSESQIIPMYPLVNAGINSFADLVGSGINCLTGGLINISPNLPTGSSNSSGSSATPSTSPIVTQVSGQAAITITIWGYAIRVGYPIDLPTLKTYGNGTPQLKDQSVTHNSIIGYTGDYPIYASIWSKTYLATNSSTDNSNVQLDNVPNQVIPSTLNS